MIQLILQIFIVNWFLDGEFLQFGTKVVQFSFEDQEDRMDPMSRYLTTFERHNIYATRHLSNLK